MTVAGTISARARRRRVCVRARVSATARRRGLKLEEGAEKFLSREPVSTYRPIGIDPGDSIHRARLSTGWVIYRRQAAATLEWYSLVQPIRGGVCLWKHRYRYLCIAPMPSHPPNASLFLSLFDSFSTLPPSLFLFSSFGCFCSFAKLWGRVYGPGVMKIASILPNSNAKQFSDVPITNIWLHLGID